MIEQPLFMRYGEGRTHRPDAFVAMRNGLHEIREIKPEVKAVEDERKWEAIGHAAAAMGYVYRVITEDRLSHPSRVANIEQFMQDRHTALPDENTLEEIWEFFGNRSIRVSELEANFPDLGRKCLHALLRAAFLTVTDLDEPFDSGSFLRAFRRKVMRIGGAFLESSS